jgi:hypothetical protein
MITGFRGRFTGQEVYVFGSGSSLEHFQPSFFDNKICVATNRVGFEYGLKNYYTCSNHYEAGNEYPGLGVTSPIICPDRDVKNLDGEPIPDSGNVFRYRASQQQSHLFDADIHWPTDDDTLVVGSSSVHTSIHFAQWAGATTIIIVGLDMGTLDGNVNFGAYLLRPHFKGRDTGETDRSWEAWEPHTRKVVARIRAAGCNVYSLNPFMNWNLEGHQYRGANAIN